jgi:hypothetical protein
VLSGPPIAAERMMYGGPNWSVGHAGVGTDQIGTTWRFTEGINSAVYESYLILANPVGLAPAYVNLAFTKTDGAVVTVGPIGVPPSSRVNVWLKGIAGLEHAEFRTVVSVINQVGIVVERATYWPLNAGGPLSLATQAPASDAGTLVVARDGTLVEVHEVVLAVPAFDPYAPGAAHGTGPRLYQRLVGYPGPDGTPSSGSAPDTGPPQSGAEAAAASSSRGSAPLMTTTVTVSWYGAHLTGGRRQ